MDLSSIEATFRLAAWVIMLASIIASVGIGVVFRYQWSHFGEDHGLATLTLMVYGAGCFVIFALLFFGAYTFFV